MTRPLTTEEAAAIERAKTYLEGASLAPPETRAFMPSVGSEAPELSSDPRILDRFAKAIRECGLVGESALAKLAYLVITSRVLERPASLGVKGLSSSGKSYTVEQVLRFFPKSAVWAKTAVSQRALIYTKESFVHRTIILYEADALREGNDEDQTAYFVRSLLSEGRIDYEVTVRSPEKGEGWTTKSITKPGPSNLIFTTTREQIHGENETRVLSITSDDSNEQTARILAGLAKDTDKVLDLTPWMELQEWIGGAEHRVWIPYAPALAGLVPPAAVRLRRDFGAVLGLIKAHAILHQLSRERDQDGRIVASLGDYEVVRELVAPLISEGVGRTVSVATKEAVQGVVELSGANPEGVTGTILAATLSLDPSAARRRLEVAARGGWVVNREDRPHKPGRWVIGEPLPTAEQILPSAARVQAEGTGDARAGEADLISDDPSECATAESSGRAKEDGVQPLPYAPRDPLRPFMVRVPGTAPPRDWSDGAGIPKFWPDGTPYSLDRPLEEHDQYALGGDGVLPL